MKRTKKIVSILLTLVMALAMSIPAFAEGGEGGVTPNGTITIQEAVPGAEYKIYRLFDLESYNTSGNYSYKVNSDWENWLNNQTGYLTIKDKYLEGWKEGADVSQFAKLAQDYAVSNSIAPVTTATAPEAESGKQTSTVTFTGLKLGYYLVDTSFSTVCYLSTTKPDATIVNKNDIPTIEKKVKEDSTNNWGDENTAEIGQTVEFKSTVHAKKGAKSYVVHDVMSLGLTLNPDSIKVFVLTKTENDEKETEKELLMKTVNSESFDYEVTSSGCTDGCTFEIKFSESYLDTITADTDIFITYTAILNKQAVISTDANTNKTKLEYSENINGNPSYSTAWDETKTYTFMFDIVKTDASKKLLTGAKFELYDNQTDGNKIALVKESDGSYRVATADEKKVENFESAVIEATDGKAKVKGLDANTTYWLEEIEAPAGYNKLSERVKVDIKEINLSTTMKETDNTWEEGDGGVQITNNTGAELPSTGGIGTTVFYAAGVILALGAAVVLVARRRMRTE